MRRIWGLLLALALFAVAIGGAWWLLARASWRPPASIKPALPEIAAMSGFEMPQGRHALERPILWSSRAPVEAAEATPEAAPESEIAQLRLMAVLESGGQRVALLQRPDRSVLKLNSAAPEGDWRLDSFDGLVAVFVSGTGQRVERPLERTGATPAAARPGPSAGAPSRPAPGAAVQARQATAGERPAPHPRAAVPAPSHGMNLSQPAPTGPPRSQPPASPSRPGAAAPAGV